MYPRSERGTWNLLYISQKSRCYYIATPIQAYGRHRCSVSKIWPAVLLSWWGGMSWREYSQILRAQITSVGLKIKRKGKLSIPDLQLLRNRALLFMYTNPLQSRAAQHKKVRFSWSSGGRRFPSFPPSLYLQQELVEIIVLNTTEGLNTSDHNWKKNSDSTARKFSLVPFPMIAHIWWVSYTIS